MVRTLAALAVAWLGALAHAQTISVSPTSVAFAPQVVGTTSAPVVVTITNTGFAPLNITAFLHYNTCTAVDCFTVPFALSVQSSTCSAGPVAPGATCTVTLVFAPFVAGGWSSSLFVAYGPSLSTLAVTGTALAGTASMEPVPTLSEWGMIGLMLALVAAAARSRGRRAAT